MPSDHLWKLNISPNILEYASPTLPTEDSFADWSQSFCNDYELKLIELSIGADRSQLHFQFKNYDYLLCLELTCEALWIEGSNALSSEKLDLLYQHLAKDTLVRALDM